MDNRITQAIARTNKLIDDIEELFPVNKEGFPSDEKGRNWVLLAYYSLVFELSRAIIHLIEQESYAAACTLIRPITEAVVRAHVVLMCSDDVFMQILSDEYRMNTKVVGKEIDAFYKMENLMEPYLTFNLKAMHSYTHIGSVHIGRRVKVESQSDVPAGAEKLSFIASNYEEEELLEVVHHTSVSAFLVNYLVLEHFKFDEAWRRNFKLFLKWDEFYETLERSSRNFSTSRSI